jgi:hypothetical protein
MSVPLHRPGAAAPHGDARGFLVTRRHSNANDFKNQVASAVRDSSQSGTQTPASSHAAQSGAEAAANNLPDWRLIFGLGQATAAKSETARSESASDAGLKQAEAAQPATPLDALKAALSNAGIDPESLDITAHDDPVLFPGGGWTNRLLTVTTVGGATETFMADLVAKTPHVAAVEIQSLLARG